MRRTSNTLRTPLEGLPPGAAALIETSKQLLIDGGIDALRVAKITEAAGQNRAMVNYYFGSKAAMVAAVVDSLIHEAVEELVAQAESLPRGETRVVEHVKNTMSLMQTPEFISTIDVIPTARRNEDLRGRMAQLYEWYRETSVECLDPEADDDRGQRLGDIATLFVAIFDGLAIQWALDPDAVALERMAVLVSEMLNALLAPGTKDAADRQAAEPTF